MATKQVIISNLTTESTLDATAMKEKYGNDQIRIHCDGGTVKITDCHFGSNGYNMIISGYSDGLNPVTRIDIENCEFTGELTNNAISLFNLGEGTIINIKNCHFVNVSNALRISNEKYAQNVTINIENCVVDKWSSDRYAGFLCMQDYTSAHMKESFENLAFGPSMKINFKNLTYNGSKVTGNLDDLISHFSTKKLQLAYMYISNGLAHDVTYINNKKYFPTFSLT